MLAHNFPSVFILNLSYTGLNIARAFAGTGIRVYGIGSRRWVCGNFSRYTKFYLSPDSLTEPESLYCFLVALAKEENKKPIIFPTRDHDLIFLNNYREKLESYFIIAQPERRVLDIVLNKWILFQVAHECNVFTPETYLINNKDELQKVSFIIEYPVLIKPLHAADWRKKGIWEAVGARKAIYCQTEKVLWREYNRFQHIHPVVLLQKYIDGGDSDIYTFCSYCDEQSNVLVSFNTRKILQMPERIGTGVIVQSAVELDIADCSRRLLKHIGFTGVSEIEYKKDPTTGNYYLIEINPRFWDQHQLSRSFGINLPLIAYHHLHNTCFPILPSKYHKSNWIAEDSLITCLTSMVLRSREKVVDIFYELSGNKSYAIWSAEDPLPFIVSMISMIIDMIRRIAKKIL